MRLFVPGFALVVFSFVLHPHPVAYVLGNIGYWTTFLAIIVAIGREHRSASADENTRMRLLSRLYDSRFLSHMFHTLPQVLQAELRGCETVLDLGCGPSSPVGSCNWIRRSVGVEPFKPYYEKARESKTHTELLNCRIEDLDFAESSFDAVTLIEVIEHMEEAQALEVLKKAQKWAKKKVIVTSPNGFVPQGVVDGNDLQQHLSGWPLQTMKALGFRCVGLAGLKGLRRDAHAETMTGDVLASIRWHPRALWFAIAAVSQMLTYRVPSLAFGLFSVKDLQ